MPKRAFFVHISRILSGCKARMIIYLGRLLPTGSCGSLLSDFGSKIEPKSDRSTALHVSKDLAVSPYILLYKLFLKIRNPFAFALGVSARTSNLAVDGDYPLPSSIKRDGRVRTFLPFLLKRAIIVCLFYTTITNLSQLRYHHLISQLK